MSRILVIDDDSDVLESVARVLHNDGYDVATATDGSLGVQVAQAEPCDLILCDITMPKLDGYGVFRQIKNDAKTSTIPFVFLTALSSRADYRKGMELGADDYLAKPFSHTELLSCVRTQISKSHLIADRYESTLRLVRKNVMYALPHELRTPLAHIMGYAGLLEMQGEPINVDIIHQYGESIHHAGRRLHHLIENYLVYAQLEIIASSPDELAKLRNHLIRNIKPVVEKAVDECAAKHNRASDLEMQLENIPLRVSENDLTKIVGELVDNALKFSPVGANVRIQTRRSNDAVELTIEDSGRGMSAEQVSLLGAYMQFDRAFYEQQGIGLGFMIAKRLIELYGGTIAVESEMDTGTIIRIAFPYR